MKILAIPHAAGLALLLCVPAAHGQQAAGGAGSLEFAARITPTAGRPEPVRQFTFYLLRKSYADIAREAEKQDPLPTREQFIDGLSLSAPLKTWMKARGTMDLTSPEAQQGLTADDIVNIPEFLDAYLRANSGGATASLPRPKYSKADKTANPERYRKLHDDYIAALRRFIAANTHTTGGMEEFLDAVNPARPWNQLNAEHRRKMRRRLPEIAQTKYLAAKADTDLEGHAYVSGLPAGTYWLSTLGLEVSSGDLRLRWDVPFTIEPGKTARIELTNLNAAEENPSAP